MFPAELHLEACPNLSFLPFPPFSLKDCQSVFFNRPTENLFQLFPLNFYIV
jgi:hypothetical protein